MTSQIELLPCPNPWCDEESEPTFYHGASGQWRVNCSCGIASPWNGTMIGAIVAWNTRPSPSGTSAGEDDAVICEACMKPVERGQFVHCYEDVGEVHVDCDQPNAFSDDPMAVILVGDPLRRAALRSQGRGEGVPADSQGPLASVLREHWLTGTGCDKEAGTNTATCYCSVWRSEPTTSPVAAVDMWIAHVLECLATISEGTPALSPPIADVEEGVGGG